MLRGELGRSPSSSSATAASAADALGPGSLRGVVEVPADRCRRNPAATCRVGEHGRVGNPGGRLHVGHRSPIVHQWEVAQPIAELFRTVPIGRVYSTRAIPSRRGCGWGRACKRNRLRSPCCAWETTRRTTEPPPVVREQVPNLRLLDAVVRRGPHLHLPLDRASRTRWPPRRAPPAHVPVVMLPFAPAHVTHGKLGVKLGDLAAGHKVSQPRHHGHVFFAQRGDGKQNGRLRHGRSIGKKRGRNGVFQQ